ncbi:GNAT family N-acetyltransferase [Saccharomonospora sp. NPDC006951]
MTDSTDPATSKVVRNDDKARYEIWWGDELAGFASFRQRGERTVFVHTEIGDDFGGKGLGSALAKGALDDVVRREQFIVAVCPFIAAYLRKHPGYADHVVNRDGGK